MREVLRLRKVPGVEAYYVPGQILPANQRKNQQQSAAQNVRHPVKLPSVGRLLEVKVRLRRLATSRLLTRLTGLRPKGSARGTR